MSAADPEEVLAFRERRDAVLERIARGAERSGRNPAAVTLVAVSKTVASERLEAAVEAGFTLLGENRVQEAASKVDRLTGVRWHLIGPLQSNKARRAIELFDTIESVDSVDLARRLDRLAGEIGSARFPVFLQVNVDRDPRKAGFDPDVLEASLADLVALPTLEVRGLMTVGRLVPDPEEARPTFAALRDLSVRLRRAQPLLGAGLSMGMSDDFEVAIEEGATVVRVGRAIFGERPRP